MTSFLRDFLVIIMIFCFCVGISLIIRLIALWFKKKVAPPAQKNPQPVIYYVTNEETKQKKKRRRRKSPDVALKGLMITPEKFQAIKNNHLEK